LHGVGENAEDLGDKAIEQHQRRKQQGQEKVFLAVWWHCMVDYLRLRGAKRRNDSTPCRFCNSDAGIPPALSHAQLDTVVQKILQTGI